MPLSELKVLPKLYDRGMGRSVAVGAYDEDGSRVLAYIPRISFDEVFDVSWDEESKPIEAIRGILDAIGEIILENCRLKDWILERENHVDIRVMSITSNELEAARQSHFRNSGLIIKGCNCSPG